MAHNRSSPGQTGTTLDTAGLQGMNGDNIVSRLMPIANSDIDFAPIQSMCVRKDVDELPTSPAPPGRVSVKPLA